MRLMRYWAASRLLALVAVASLAHAVTRGSTAAPLAGLVAASVGLVAAWLVGRSRRRRALALEPVGTRAGLVAWAADSMLLLALAALAPLVGGAALAAGPHAAVAAVQALALLSVAHLWLRVAAEGDPADRTGFVHSALVLMIAPTAWLLAERSVPSGHGVEQALPAAVAALLAAAGILLGGGALAGRRAQRHTRRA